MSGDNIGSRRFTHAIVLESDLRENKKGMMNERRRKSLKVNVVKLKEMFLWR